MKLSEIAAQLEDDLQWRQDELRLLGNQINSLSVTRERAISRKAQLVMLYAHYEGYCKFAFDLYASTINAEGLTCADVNYCLAASCLTKLFTGLVDTNRPTDTISGELQDDAVVRRLTRQVELVKSLDVLWETMVDIPVDKVIDTESNLSPKVLKKILHRLGFDHNAFDSHEQDVRRLLTIRNEIAHGFKCSGIDESLYSNLESKVYNIMTAVKTFVWDSLKDGTYKKP